MFWKLSQMECLVDTIDMLISVVGLGDIYETR